MSSLSTRGGRSLSVAVSHIVWLSLLTHVTQQYSAHHPREQCIYMAPRIWTFRLPARLQVLHLGQHLGQHRAPSSFLYPALYPALRGAAIYYRLTLETRATIQRRVARSRVYYRVIGNAYRDAAPRYRFCVSSVRFSNTLDIATYSP